jgi:uncharacterized protein YydD (DUF2326 family)
MIVLKRLYSETNLFEEVEFKLGINIILGRYSSNEQREGINGIGKSSIVRLIDLAFLGDANQRYFLQKKYSFLYNHSFTLEFEIDKQLYSIKRLFNKKKLDTWFSIGIQNYQEYEADDLKLYLSNLLFLKEDLDLYIDASWFRDLIRFFIKDDINRQTRTNPMDFISDGRYRVNDMVLLYKNFFLLGLPNHNIVEYEKHKKELDKKKVFKKNLVNEIENDTNTKIDHFKSQLFELEKDITLLEKVTNDYHFLPLYQKSEQQLTFIEKSVSEKLKIRKSLLREKENYDKSSKINLNADIQKVEKIYRQINEELSKVVAKKLNEVVAFRKEIVENRRLFLKERQSVIESELNILSMEIVKLEEERSSIYKILDEKKALDSLKNAYQELIVKKTKLETSKVNLQKIDKIDIEISYISTELSTIKTKLLEQVQDIEQQVKNLRALFYDVLENSIFFDEDKSGFAFEISNVIKSTSAPIKFEIDVPKSSSKGNRFFKLLAYDLTVFLNIIISERNIPHFLIHDGVYDELEPAKTIKVLNYMHKNSFKYPTLQYIIVANEYELKPSEEDKARVGDYDFNLMDNVIKILEDSPNKMFFKRSFT